MKRQNTDIYANIQDDSVQQNEELSEQSQQNMIQQNQSDTKQNMSDAKLNNLQKKEKLKASEFKINHNQVKDKFSNILNSQQLVDEDINTPRDKFMMKSNNFSGFETQRQSLIKKQIDQVLGTKSTGKSSFLQQFEEDIESKKKTSGSHSLYGLLNSTSKDIVEQKAKNIIQYNRLAQYQNIIPSSSQRVNSETDVKNKKSDNKFTNETKQNEIQSNIQSSIPGVFIQSRFTALKQSQNQFAQNKSLSLQQSKSQYESGRGTSQKGIKPLNKAALSIALNSSPFIQSTPTDSKKVKIFEDSGQKSDGGQSLFFSSRLNVSQNNSSSQNNVKFKRLQNTEPSQKQSTDQKGCTINDFRNVSYLHQKSKDSPNPVLIEEGFIQNNIQNNFYPKAFQLYQNSLKTNNQIKQGNTFNQLV